MKCKTCSGKQGHEYYCGEPICPDCNGTGKQPKCEQHTLRNFPNGDYKCTVCGIISTGQGYKWPEEQPEEEVVSQKEINHDANREKELQLLCKSVLSLCTESVYDSNGLDSCYCPLCDAESYGGLNMNEIKHNHDCGWLIAKGLSTRTGES